MERLKRLAQGTMSSSELHMLNRIFDAATTQSWFDDADYSHEGFAVGLIDLFRCGIVKPIQLERIAMIWALSEFSRNMSAAQRVKLKSAYERCKPERTCLAS